MAIFTADNVISLLKFTNILVILYAVGFAFRFISLTMKDEARKPWEYMSYAIVILLLLQVIGFLNLEKVYVDKFLTQIMTLALSTLLLLVFITQEFHMKKENFSTMTRKDFVAVKKK